MNILSLKQSTSNVQYMGLDWYLYSLKMHLMDKQETFLKFKRFDDMGKCLKIYHIVLE